MGRHRDAHRRQSRPSRNLLSYLRSVQSAQIALAVGAFVVWVYYLRGPFALDATDWYNQRYAAVFLPLYVAVGPQLVPSVLRKWYRVGDGGDGEGGSGEDGDDDRR
ncbi:hypothetical protein [Halorussus caseinilyticus]|uniref:Uncharacterized protein n=1 Tax=Halorussus caseinilyticus TaxID=3034025 RepID=A0ABD5WPY8_9EURY